MLSTSQAPVWRVLRNLLFASVLVLTTAACRDSDPCDATIGDGATFIGLGDLPGGEFLSIAVDVSSDGSVILGMGTSTEGYTGFLWKNCRFEDLGMLPEDLGTQPGGDFFYATAISADGSVVVGWSGPENRHRHALRRRNGVVENLHPSGVQVTNSYADDVSVDGSVVVGFIESANGLTGVRWENGTIRYLVDEGGSEILYWATAVSDDGSVVVGYGQEQDGPLYAARWRNGVIEKLAGQDSVSADPLAVSPDASVIVGTVRVSAGRRAAIRWKDGEPLLLDPARKYDRTLAWDTSADGSVVVGSVVLSATGDGLALIWTEQDGMRELKDVLENEYGLDLTGWALQSAAAVSDDGRVIVGRGMNPGGNPEAWRVVLPAQ